MNNLTRGVDAAMFYVIVEYIPLSYLCFFSEKMYCTTLFMVSYKPSGERASLARNRLCLREKASRKGVAIVLVVLISKLQCTYMLAVMA